MNTEPFLSIVIANYNYGSMLPVAIESIIHQDCNDYELIIVDGGSTDNSVEVIRSYERYVSWWVSEPDAGQSNAFNKGFSHAKGRYLTWLNADDILLPGTIRAVKTALEKNPSAAYATGNFIRFLNSDKTIIQAKWGPNYLPRWMQGKGRYSVVFGPTTFWKKSVYEKLGPIDESLHFAMDIEYWARMMLAGYKQVRVNHYCWAFRMHEDSKTATFGNHEMSDLNKERLEKERKYIYEKLNYHPRIFWRIVSLFLRLIDGSYIKSIYNSTHLVGKSVIDYFGLIYHI